MYVCVLLTDAAYEGGRLRFTEVPLSYSDGVLSGSTRTVANFVVVVLQQLVVTGTRVDQLQSVVYYVAFVMFV